VPVRCPVHVDFLQQLPCARNEGGSDLFPLSKTPRTLDVANRLLWQLSFPAASLLLTSLLTQRACRHSGGFCIRTFASAVHKEVCQSLHGAIFFAAAMVWTCFSSISLFFHFFPRL
jgi:hypothetical protein